MEMTINKLDNIFIKSNIPDLDKLKIIKDYDTLKISINKFVLSDKIIDYFYIDSSLMIGEIKNINPEM